MRSLLIGLLAAFCATAASGETFQTPYSPTVAQVSKVTLTKCTDVQMTGKATTNNCTTLIYTEEVTAKIAEGYRIKYTATSGVGTYGDVSLSLAQRFPFVLITDERGAPLRLENQNELLQNMRTLLTETGAANPDPVIQMFEQLTPENAASILAKDFAALSELQGIGGEVGIPMSAPFSSPFPLKPTETLTGTVSFQYDSIDRPAGVAFAHIDTTYDPKSTGRAMRAFRDDVLAKKGAKNVPRDDDADWDFAMTSRIAGTVDIKTGETRKILWTRTLDATQNGQKLHRVETSNVERSLLTR